MKLLKYLFILLSFTLLSCGQNKNDQPKAENALDAGREFIDACLKGDFKKAQAYMLDDDTNLKLLDKLQLDWKAKSLEEKTKYKTASINIAGVEELNDSTTLINYSNSYDNIARKVKVLNRDKDWWVDFKYTFNGNL
jgi:hypothetical protein